MTPAARAVAAVPDLSHVGIFATDADLLARPSNSPFRGPDAAFLA